MNSSSLLVNPKTYFTVIKNVKNSTFTLYLITNNILKFCVVNWKNPVYYISTGIVNFFTNNLSPNSCTYDCIHTLALNIINYKNKFIILY